MKVRPHNKSRHFADHWPELSEIHTSESPAATGLYANYQEPSNAEIFQQSEPIAKDFATMRAQFALRGRVLTRSHRVPDGRVTYVVTTRWSGSRYFTHLHDVQGHLNQVMEGHL